MELKFGTAGIRGIMGPEPGQMNLETVRLATRGVAGWLKGAEPVEARKDLLVVISRDSRNNSLAFAEDTARKSEKRLFVFCIKRAVSEGVALVCI